MEIPVKKEIIILVKNLKLTFKFHNSLRNMVTNNSNNQDLLRIIMFISITNSSNSSLFLTHHLEHLKIPRTFMQEEV